MAMIAALENETGRLPDAQCQIRRDHAVRATAHAVGTKILAQNVLPAPNFRAFYTRISGERTRKCFK